MAAAAADAPGQMSEAAIQSLVADAIAQAIADSPEPLTEQEIAQIVMAAIPTPVPTPTRHQRPGDTGGGAGQPRQGDHHERLSGALGLGYREMR